MRALRVAVTCLSLVATTPVLAGVADGTWACSDAKGKALGVLALTDTSYTFTRPDGTAAEGGTIYYQGKDPAFVVEKGGLQTELTAIGAILDKDASGPVLYIAVEHGLPVQCAPQK